MITTGFAAQAEEGPYTSGLGAVSALEARRAELPALKAPPAAQLAARGNCPSQPQISIITIFRARLFPLWDRHLPNDPPLPSRLDSAFE